MTKIHLLPTSPEVQPFFSRSADWIFCTDVTCGKLFNKHNFFLRCFRNLIDRHWQKVRTELIFLVLFSNPTNCISSIKLSLSIEYFVVANILPKIELSVSFLATDTRCPKLQKTANLRMIFVDFQSHSPKLASISSIWVSIDSFLFEEVHSKMISWDTFLASEAWKNWNAKTCLFVRYFLIIKLNFLQTYLLDFLYQGLSRQVYSFWFFETISRAL